MHKAEKIPKEISKKPKRDQEIYQLLYENILKILSNFVESKLVTSFDKRNKWASWIFGKLVLQCLKIVKIQKVFTKTKSDTWQG